MYMYINGYVLRYNVGVAVSANSFRDLVTFR